MVRRRVGRWLVGITFGLVLLVPARAWAACEFTMSDSGDNGGEYVWGWHYAEFDPTIYIPDALDCGQVQYYDSVVYAIQTEVRSPEGTETGYGGGEWWGESYAAVPIAAGGYGTYTVTGSGDETICTWAYGCFGGSFVFGDRYEQVWPPTATLYAANYSPPQNSSPVLVWAEMSGNGYLTNVVWDGCLPASSIECYVDTSTPGQRTVFWWGLFVNVWRFASVQVDVQPEQQQLWPIPSGEFTEACGDTWFEGAARWCMTLVGLGGNFYGRRVQEFPSGTGLDTCNERVPNSIIPPAQLTGGPPGGWQVSQSNFWGADQVGWSTFAVNYYRGYGVEPCGFVLSQSMRINQVDGTWVEYVVNQLSGTIGTSTVASWRAGQTVERVWPE